MTNASRTYRPYLALRIAVVAAFTLWFFVTALAFRLPTLPASMGFQALLLCLSFVLFCAYWLPLQITVDDRAITYRGLLGLRRLAFEDIQSIEVTPIPGMTNYDIRTRNDDVVFTSFIAGHKDLMDLVVARARMVPRFA